MTSLTSYTYDVFLSYSHLDRSWVDQELLPRLEGAGLRVSIGRRDFEIGIPRLINIERAVDTSRHTVLVLTPAWLESEWTEFESLLAGSSDPAGRRRRLLPLKVASCELPSRINFLSYADFTTPEDCDSQFSRLIEQLHAPSAPSERGSHDMSVFIAGPPVEHPSRFFGHKRQLKRLFNLWKGLPLQNAAIIGPRRSGKTSFLLYLKNITTTPQDQLRSNQNNNWLPFPDRYNWILVDFQDPRMGSRQGLLRYLLSNMNLITPNPLDMDHFMDVVSRSLRTPTIVLLDEVGVMLERYSELDDVFWEAMRSLAGTHTNGNFGFVLAAHESPVQLAANNSRSSPFFNIFGYVVQLGPLEESEARELIASSPISFADTDIDWILARSERWPLLLQILCRERLLALQEGETDDSWQEEGLRQLAPFLEIRSKEH